jgi:hexosaminidase
MKRILAGLLNVSVGIFLMLSSSCVRYEPGPAEVKIIPKPQHLELGEGTFRMDRKTSFYLLDPNPALRRAAEIFAGYVNAASSFRLAPDVRSDVTGETDVIVVRLSGDHNLYGDEGYSLIVSPQQITITAARPAGAFYGMQTLRQLFPPELEDSTCRATAWQIPCVDVFDRPVFTWRGDMLDVSRHFLPLEFLKRNIDYLARYKMNIFHWHLTDDQGWRIEVKGYPKLTTIGAWRVDHEDLPWHDRPSQKPGEKATYGGYYTQEQVRELVRYAADRFVTIVPEIDMPGHSQAIVASYPELACGLGPHYVATGGKTSDNTLCPAKEETYRFVKGLLNEVLPLFPGPYFHVGGDECNKRLWKDNPLCQELMKKEGMKDVKELQSYFIRRVEKIVNGLGKKMVGWDEILQGGLAPNATVMSWRGIRGGILAAKMDHDVVMTPLPYTYLSRKQGDPELEPGDAPYGVLLSKTYSFDPVPAELSVDEASHILGTEGCLWGEFVPDVERANYMLFPRLLAIAEVGWTPADSRHWEDFVDRLDYNLLRLKNVGIGYAPSVYNVTVTTLPDSVGHRVLVQLTTEHGKVPVRYTFDGSEPDAASPLYERPVTVPGPVATLKAAAFRGDERIGRITVKTFTLHKAAGATVTFSIPPSPRHAPGPHALTDGLLDSANPSSKCWTAWQGTSPAITIDLGRKDTVRSVTVNCLEAQRSSIFLPQEIRVFVSREGKHFMTRGILYRELKEQTFPQPVPLVLNIPPTYGRYVRLEVKATEKCPEWHRATGKKAWLFMDEIMVE